MRNISRLRFFGLLSGLILGLVLYVGAPVFLLAGESMKMELKTSPEKLSEEGLKPDRPPAVEYIGFMPKGQAFFYRQNKNAGRILVITGTVRNNYPEPRCLVRLRGRLLSVEEAILSERFAYAGIQLTEEDLTDLPISELNALLNVKDDQVFFLPGGELPFMLLFDQLPEASSSYVLEALASSPVEE